MIRKNPKWLGVNMERVAISREAGDHILSRLKGPKEVEVTARLSWRLGRPTDTYTKICCVTMSKSLDLSEPWFLHLLNDNELQESA